MTPQPSIIHARPGDVLTVELADGDSFAATVERSIEQELDPTFTRLVTDMGTVRWHHTGVSFWFRPLPGEALGPAPTVRAVRVRGAS